MLTNGSDGVTGTSKDFLSDVENGDFILVTVGGASYFLLVNTVDNATALTLKAVYDGPTQSGLAWKTVVKGTYASIPSELIAKSASALRAQTLDKSNWQKVFSAHRYAS